MCCAVRVIRGQRARYPTTSHLAPGMQLANRQLGACGRRTAGALHLLQHCVGRLKACGMQARWYRCSSRSTTSSTPPVTTTRSQARSSSSGLKPVLHLLRRTVVPVEVDGLARYGSGTRAVGESCDSVLMI